MTPAPARTVKHARKPRASSAERKARGSRQRRGAELAAARQRDEAEHWMSSARTAVDASAVGHAGGWESTVLSLVDWSSGRACGCLLERQADEICPGVVKQRGRALARQEHRSEVLARLCQGCENPPHHVMTEDDLRRARPGAEHPSWDCSGCPFAFVGIVDEQDKSMAAVFQPDATLRHHIRFRALQVLRRGRGK